MTKERAEELIGQKVLFFNGWRVVLRGIFISGETGEFCGMCYVQDENGEDWAGMSCTLESLREIGE